MGLLRRLYELPPKDSIRKARRKLAGPRTAAGPDLEDILSDPKVMRSQRLYDFLSRYEAILGRHCDWRPLDFEDRRVLEIGSGPLLGWAPLAIFRGCQHYVCVEPSFNPTIVFSSALLDKYFLPLHKDLCAMFGERLTFSEFVERLRSKITVHKNQFLGAEIAGERFDIVLSNSCLEHIFPLDESIKRLRGISSTDGRFLHLVDFGNHRPTRNPFQGMYCVEPPTYLAKYGNKVNLHRASDLVRIFQSSGFDTTLTPYYHYREFFDETVLPYWSDKYSDDDLFLKAGLIAGKIA